MAAGPITRQQLSTVVQPIMNDNFDGVYNQRRHEWKPLFTEKEGMKRSSHVETVLFGFGNAPLQADGAPLAYDQGGTQYTIYFPYDQYALGFAITEQAREDSEWLDITETFTKHLAQSLYETEEINAANILNYGFNAAFTQYGGDGLPLFSSQHPLAVGGTYSNNMTPAALSMTSLEDMLVQIGLAVDARGKKINLEAERLVVPQALKFQAAVVLKSILNPDTTGSNQINPINSENYILGGYQVVTRLTSNTAWFVTTNAGKVGANAGLVRLNRVKMKKGVQEDFNTDSVQVKASSRYRYGWIDPRGCWGNAGA